MKTVHLQATAPGAVEEAATLLRVGQLVVFPTDTVYGIGVTVFSEEAIAALYEAKERPTTKGIPLLLADESDLARVASTVPAVAHELATGFWPGPLTLVVPQRSGLPANLSPNENVAVRIPDNDVARALIRAAGGAVAASSANRSGEPPATNTTMALATFGGVAAAVLDGGPSTHGQPSTIVDCTVDPPVILRSGALSAAALGITVQKEE